jgi:hypothetical protein
MATSTLVALRSKTHSCDTRPNARSLYLAKPYHATHDTTRHDQRHDRFVGWVGRACRVGGRGGSTSGRGRDAFAEVLRQVDRVGAGCAARPVVGQETERLGRQAARLTHLREQSRVDDLDRSVRVCVCVCVCGARVRCVRVCVRWSESSAHAERGEC